MRLSHTLTLAIALIAAAPAAAQDNNVASENAAVTQSMDANATAAPAPEAAPAAQTTAPPADATQPAPASSRGLPWGAIGLIGLVGLLGARKAKG